jgi:hypothetical protein
MQRRTDSLSWKWDKAAWQQDVYHLNRATGQLEDPTVRRPGFAFIEMNLAVEASAWVSYRVEPATEPRSQTQYVGIVERVDGLSVLVRIHRPGDSDMWEACINLAHFRGQMPTDGDKFMCEVTVSGSYTSIRAKVLPRTSRRSLEELGVNKKEFLERISTDV